MPAKVVTITSGKGGVGKTTAVANLAVALASEGSKVVCIDGDIGLRNLDVILGLELVVDRRLGDAHAAMRTRHERGKGKYSISNNKLPVPAYMIAAAKAGGAGCQVQARDGFCSANVCRLRGIFWCRRRRRHICRLHQAWSRELSGASSVGR